MKRGSRNLSLIFLINVILILAISSISATGCVDSDSGSTDYYNQGYINITNSSNISTFLKYDSCRGNTLLELYCNSDNYNTVEYNCPYGCSNGTCLEKQESISLRKGWNLVSFSAFRSLFNTSGPSNLNNLDLEAIYTYDRNKNEYIRIHPSIEVASYILFNTSETGETTNTAIWVLAKKDTTYKFKEVQSFPASLNNVKLKKGWNFLTFVPNMTGNSLNKWIGDCEVEKASIWSESGQGWDTADESKGDFNANLPGSLLWKGLVLKVYNNCTLKDPEKVSPEVIIPGPPGTPITPGAVCNDTDRGENLLEKGILRIDNVIKGTDICINNETLKEYSCHFTNGVAEGIDNKTYTCLDGCFEGACKKPNANNTLIETDIGEFIFSNTLVDSACQLILDPDCSQFIADYDLPLGGFNSLITIIEDHYLNNFTNNNFTELGANLQGEKYFKNYNENPVLEIKLSENANRFLWYNHNKTIEISITGWDKTKLSEDDLSIFIEAYLRKYPSGLYFNNVTECTDSDSGLNYFVEGSCVDKFGTSLSDSCVTGNRIKEIECENNTKCVEIEYSCSNGCNNNKCNA